MLSEHGSNLDRAIQTVFERYEAVSLGYLFGSVCTGRQGPLSDIDIAVLLRDDSLRKSIEGQIQDALCRTLHTDRVDFVSLADAPSSLAYRVIREGRCIYCSDQKTKESFETAAVMRYLDFKPVREQAFRVSRDRILERV